MSYNFSKYYKSTSELDTSPEYSHLALEFLKTTAMQSLEELSRQQDTINTQILQWFL